jgi:predicted dehydrogenase
MSASGRHCRSLRRTDSDTYQRIGDVAMPVTSQSRRRFLATSSLLSAGALAMAADDKPGGSKRDDSGASTSAATSKGSGRQIELAPPDKQPPKLELPEVVDRKVGWAIVGLGQLALEEVMPAFGECKHSQPVALVSGHADKAKRVAEAYGIDTKRIYNYENYDELARDERVQVIYIILPNSMHAEYTIRGLKAGKHVLCEKPMAVTTEECERMIAAADQANRKLMIAYRLQYEPFNMKVIEWCRDKKIGELKLIYASNGQDVAAPNIRLSRKLGGGPVGDVGVYCINAARYITGEEPVEVTAHAHSPDDPRFDEVPESVVFTLRFPSGVLAHCDCSFGTAENRQYRVLGNKGTIDLERAFGYFGQQLSWNDGDGPQDVQLKPVNHFAAEMDHFSQCVLNNRDSRTPGSEGLADMRVVEAIDRAASDGKLVKIKG